MYTDYNDSVKAIDIGELYEHSLSIRYCYPHILELKSEKSIMNQDEQNKLIEQLPVEMWISIFKHLDKQDIQLMKIVWEAEDVKKF
ncbi:unnamed protein product [Rotaria magnacalcarata]|uniref:F-box domain-containing protein n=1 Tax=Rotaria magnacalcarata TaxID=392030 RepID=A0A8S3C278_9BILA|nr:unnamed protein product [Rotaria magnacalcarata]CAF5025958.1 unnamed protein product [Rotaria magnacalcarata]